MSARYYYHCEGRGYAIRKRIGGPYNGSGEKIDFVWSLEEAKRKVYELNGWVYEEKKR